MTPPLTLTQAVQDLGLSYGSSGDQQDWGIINADATRLSTFVAYYLHQVPTLEDWGVEFSLGELLLESANDAWRDGTGPREDAEAAVRAILDRQTTEPTRALLDYWMNLDQPDPELGAAEPEELRAWWPVAALLRQVQADLAASSEKPEAFMKREERGPEIGTADQ